MPRITAKKKNKSSFTCEGCQITFSTLNLYVQHLPRSQLCRQKSHKCEKCNAIFSSLKSLEHHQWTNATCINLADQVSKIGHEFDVASIPSTAKKRRVLDLQNAAIRIDFNQNISAVDKDQTYFHGCEQHMDLEYTIPSDLNNGRTVSLCLKSIQNHINRLKRHFPLNLLDSTSLQRSMYIVKLLRFNNDFKDKILKGSVNGLVRDIRNHIFNIRATIGKETIPGYSFPFTFNTITDNELVWFVNYHNQTYIEAAHNFSPDIYNSVDNPEDDEDVLGDESGEDEENGDAIMQNASEDVEHDNGLNEDTEDQNIENSEPTIDTSIDEFVQSAREYRCPTNFDKEDFMLLELFDILREAGAPMYLFDKLTSWGYRNSTVLSLDKPMSREKFFKEISTKTYGPALAQAMKPIVENHIMPSTGALMDIVLFSFKAQLASLLLDDDLMSSSNLLLNKDDPSSPLFDGTNTTLDDLNSGWWHRETRLEICKNGTDILLPIIFFIDAGKVTQRQSIEPVTFTLGIFNRETRNKAEAWRTLGYMENLFNAMKSQNKKYNSKMKLTDYHYVLSVLLKEFKTLQGANGGFKHKLTLDGKTYDVTFKIAVQNIMGDCMGLNKLCLFYGSNSLETSRMCRDCDVPPLSSDDPDYQCRYTKISDLVGLTKEQFKCKSIHPLTNAMKDVYFGARDMCIYQCSPGEPLHQFLLGLIKYEYEEFESDIPKNTLRMINKIVEYYYRNFSRQSIKDMPSMAPFQNGVNDCDVLGAKEQYARLFCIYLAMNNREVIQSLCTQNRHRYDEELKRSVKIDPMSLKDAMEWFALIENTLILYQWLMSPKHNKSDVSSAQPSVDSAGQVMIRKFMHDFKNKVGKRGGHGLKLLKFHQLLHYTKQICKDGSIQNIDTGRCESIAVTMYKRISIWTQRRQMLLTKQLAERHMECVTAIELGRTLSKTTLFNRMGLRKSDSSRIKGFSGSTFYIRLENSVDNENSYLHKTVTVEWKGVPVNASYHSMVFQNLTKRLFLNTEDGGCLKHDSVVVGRTEYIDDDGDIYRAHPNYRGFGKWYDWCKILWKEDEEAIPAKIIMFLDLTDCEMMSEAENLSMRTHIHQQIDEMNNTNRRRRFANRNRIDYLSKDKWVVVRSAYSVDDQDIIDKQLTMNQKKYTTDTKITHRVLLEDECRIVPISCLSCSCYALPGTFSHQIENCEEFFVVDDITTWRDNFLN